MMKHIHDTRVSALRVRNRQPPEKTPSQKQSIDIDWNTPPKKRPGEALAKNMGVAAALVLCAVTLRSGTIPALNQSTEAILTAATDHSLLDEQLGKLSFVSSLFPEAVLVFGESELQKMSVPVSGAIVVHAWSEDEPYISMRTNNCEVFASSPGEVMGIYHGNGDERVVRIRTDDGLICSYGNLGAIDVAAGDAVQAGDAIGTLLAGEDFVFQVQRNGINIDPASYFAQ